MPIRKRDYPPDWPAISNAVRTAAGWRCEWCGAPHKAVIERLESGDFYELDWITETDGTVVTTDRLTWARLRFHGLTRIILTTAHLDRNTRNNDLSNLAALCQRCHLRHDIRQHIANRRYGRYHSREQQLKLEI